MYNDFVIHLESLKSGDHSFKFLLDTAFFESIEYSMVRKGEVIAELTLTKKDRLCELQFEYNGFIELNCDKCGGEFNFPVYFEDETILKYGEESFIDEGVWVIENTAKEVDVKHFLYESICLSIPSKVSHEDNDDENCDEKVLEKLENLSDSNDNKEIDPRWATLNKLK